jgi:predicted ATPase/DNA-binding SARP family transcriptional activator
MHQRVLSPSPRRIHSDAMARGAQSYGGSDQFIRVNTFGGLRLVVNGVNVAEDAWQRRKARQLFKILLSRPDGRIGKDQVTGLLWPDSPTSAALTNLRSALLDLRRVLGDAQSTVVCSDRDALWLSDTRVWVDVHEFEQLVARAGASSDPLALLLEANALYPGDFLADDVYDDWLDDRRQQLKQVWINVQFRLAQLWEARDAVDEAAAPLQHLLQLDACDERAARELMRLFARHRRRSEGVRVYQRLVNALRDELDSEPSEDITRIFQTELPQAPRTPTRAHNLPQQPGPIIGRADDIAAVCFQLHRPHVRLLTLLGSGGCGKTRLAIQVATDLLTEFAGGVWFIDLSSVRDADKVVFAIGRGLEIAQPLDDQPYRQRIAESIGSRRMLLILDNVEQVIEAGDQIVELLASCSELKVLVTSREPLHVRWEHEYHVPPLALVPAVAADIDVVAASPAVALFVRCAEAIRPDWHLTPANVGVVASLCNHLDRLPLAIELAAARTKLFTPEAMLARVDQSLEFLMTASRDLPQRHRGLRMAISWSHDLLSVAERTTFRRTAVFAGGWTLDAANDVVGNHSGDGTPVLETLDGLVDKSLLRVEFERDGEPRFSMLETIREFAMGELTAAGELATTQARHAAWCLALAEAAEPDLSGPGQLERLDQLEREHDNFRSALRWSFGGGDPLCGARLAAALGKFWEIHGYLQEARQWMSSALDARQDLSAARRAKLTRSAGHIAFLRSDYPASRELLGESLALAREAVDQAGVVQTLVNLASVALSSEDDERAELLLEEALTIALELADTPRAASSLQLLGLIDYHHGRLDTAAGRLEHSLAMRRALGDDWATAQTLCDLGLVSHAQGCEPKAFQQHAEALRIWGQLADHWGLAYALEGIAVLIRSDDPAAALKFVAAAAQARERVGIQAMPGRRAELEATLHSCAEALGSELYAAIRSANSARDLPSVAEEAHAILDARSAARDSQG